VDSSVAGGFTRFFGPNVDLSGKDSLGEGKIAGVEHLATVAIGGASALIMVQVPRNLNTTNPCIVTATSSGSRGIYGAIGTAGDWGLKRGCAVAYTDKSTGTGFHLLSTNQSLNWNGVLSAPGATPTTSVGAAGTSFVANLSDEQRKAYSEKSPHRVAVKQAHDQQNGERLWGQFTLAAVRHAFTVLNASEAAKSISGGFKPENTLVIASSVSNGAYAALMAAEQDREGLIDAVVATEPNVSIANHALTQTKGYAIRQGEKLAPSVGRSLLDYTTLLNLYTPCAANDPRMAKAALNVIPKPLRDARCEALAAAGYLGTKELNAQAAESIDRLFAVGIQAEALTLLPSHYTLNVYQGISVGYAMQYGRLSVTEELCGYSFAATAAANATTATPGSPVALGGANLLFATSNGIVPTGGVNLVNQFAQGGPREDRMGLSANGKTDMNTAGAICLREVATGLNAQGQPISDATRVALSQRVKRGIAETQMTGKLQGKPTIIVSPRSDAVLPVNHAGRAYFALNRQVDDQSVVRFYEVTNTQHLDAINPLPGISDSYVPIYVYFTQSMNLMWEQLVNNRRLPPSQLVRTKPRAMKDGKLEDLSAVNIPGISASLDAGTLISIRGNELNIPE
jgi:hydroxybutyrate-dimer hydrolase